MPIYEFYCEPCHTIYNFFSRSVNTGKRPACPKCGQGELVERYSARRGAFWACNRYPDCRFALPGKPLQTCPECKKGVLYEDPRHGRRCSNPDCPSRSG